MLHPQAEKLLYKLVSQKTKKLVEVLVTSTLVNEKKEELERVPYIWYPITFKD